MLRQSHSLPGLIAALLVMLLAISGAILSINPALERLHSTSTPAGQLNVGQLAGRVASHFPGVEQIQRTASGTVIVYYNQNGQAGAEKVDPMTGQGLAPYEPSAFSRWVKELHRSMFLGTLGHGVSGVGALFMLVLSVSGALLLARRLGGWRNLLRSLRGTFSQRWHAEVGRLALLGLLLSALSGLYMSAATFGFIADGSQSEPAFPPTSVRVRPCPWRSCKPCRPPTSMTCANWSTPAPIMRRTYFPCARPRATATWTRPAALCCPIRPTTRCTPSTS